jgi:F-box and leucine-rich repeat protein 1 (S-phase kinase-associated protein 2)
MEHFLDLPDELILKVLSYTETLDILRCGGVSKRIRTISTDNSLFQSLNLSGKIVKADFLETVLNKDCKSLNLSNSFIQGNLTLTQISQLRKLDSSNCQEISYDVLEELLESCHSLQILSLNGLQLSTQIYRAPLKGVLYGLFYI